MLKNFRFVVQNCRLPNLRPQPTVSSKYENLFNECIGRLFKERHYAEALDEFEFLQNRTKLRITNSSYFYLFRACSYLRSLELGRSVHDHLLASECEPDVILRNSIVDMYGKCGSLEDARKVFDEMPHRDVFSWNVMIDGYARNVQVGDAIKLYLEMLQSGFVPDHFTFASILKACSGFGDVGLGRQMHAHVLKSEFGSHHIVLRTLIWMYTMLDRIEYAKNVFSCIGTENRISWRSTFSVFCKCGFLEDARKVFDIMPHRDVASWTEFITAYVQSGRVGDAIKLYLEMLQSGVLPDHITYASILKACSGTGDVGLGRQMHAFVLKSEFGSHQTVQKALIWMYTKLDQIEYVRNVFSCIGTEDLISWGSTISLFCKYGFLEDARKLFDIMPQRDVVSWTEIINACVQNGRFGDAIRLYLEMLQSGVVPDHITFASVLKACSGIGDVGLGRQMHAHVLKSDFGSHQTAQKALSRMYTMLNHIEDARVVFSRIGTNDLISCGSTSAFSKYGSSEDPRKVFDIMPERDAISWTEIISAYVQNGRFGDAIRLYLEMLQSGVRPDHITFVSVLKACSGIGDVGLGRQMHAHVLKSEFGTHQIAQDSIIWMYTMLDQIEYAKNVFSLIGAKDLISWGSIISVFTKCGYELEALYHFREMIIERVYKPNGNIFGSAFNACRSLKMPEYGRQIHGLCIKFGFGRDASAGHSIFHMYAECGLLDPARIVFSQMENPDLVMWNAMIAGFANNGNSNVAMSLFSKMVRLGLNPNERTVLSLLSSCRARSSVHYGMMAHSYIIKLGFDTSVWVCNALITMYSRGYNVYDAYKVFNEISDNADLVSWNSILTTSMKHNHVWVVFRLFKLMFLSQIKPDCITLTTVLGTSANLASLEMGSHLHCYAIKTGLLLDVSVMNGLIEIYTKCGSLGNARTLFDSMRNPDIVSWNHLITGYAQFGYGEEALKLYRTMTSLGVKPNKVTMVGVLAASSHVGLVEEGLNLYKTMETENGFVLTKEDCTCVVDMLARAGYVQEAEAFINQTAFDTEIVVWETLLAACRTHKNLEIGERAAEKIMKINPFNSGALDTLSHIYACFGRWEDTAKLKKMMKQRSVNKSIDVKDSLFRNV